MQRFLFHLCLAHAVSFAALWAVSWRYSVYAEIEVMFRSVQLLVLKGNVWSVGTESPVPFSVYYSFSPPPEFASEWGQYFEHYRNGPQWSLFGIPLGIGVRSSPDFIGVECTFPLWLPTLLFSTWPALRLGKRVRRRARR